ncbi:hypothetical protein E8D34_06855 [Nocardioides sp. GY 10113]|uniref:hypothetical protein n=1 Tax=Nocardioides sp. GY 10113 TaxID=2569761 RepID=UPI0010A8DBFF|nr:hypothetical protein [Nocardioides sp. GY 10113]TIC88004.1 hypothetical protein E8D34_06855 [Nocardioides sp. GY 10113]
MSQPVAAPPAQQPAPPPSAGAVRVDGTGTPVAADPGAAPAFVDTPALLARWQGIGIAVVAAFAVVAALLQILAWQADGRAADDTEQLVRVQEIQSSLLRADALSTNTYLVAGLESAEKRAEYDDAIDEVLALIADAAEAQPADRAALAALNTQVNDYATGIAQARVNNRLGNPVGAAYQTQASDQLRTQARPILDNLVAANTERAEGAMNSYHPVWLALAGIAALVALWWLNRQLARAFRRRLNRGLVAAGVLVLLVTLATTLLAWFEDNANEDLRDGAFATAVDSAAARTAANDAKANESLRLILRGSGQTAEDNWALAASTVREDAPSAALGPWRTYVERHRAIVTKDESNDWEGAVRLATTAGKGGSTAPLDQVDATLQDSVDAAASDATAGLRGDRWLTLTLGLLTALVGAAAAFAVAHGIGVRRKEFL